MRRIALPVLAQLGASDCETIRDAAIAQPVNTLSSAMYLLAGGLLVLRALRMGNDDTVPQIAYGLALASVGLGSVAFHGPMPSGAQLLHDGSIVAVFAVVTAHALGTLRGRSPSRRVLVAALLTGADAVLMEAWRAVGLTVGALIAITSVALEIHLYRSGQRRVAARDVRVFAVALALLIVAGTANVLGHTDSPLCDPGSLLQGHALWHVLTAAAFGAYALVAFPVRARATTPSR